jgi:2',3'-cyclic-nucleotide 2'-phosphodiesterase (5'-nucleotidase family)
MHWSKAELKPYRVDATATDSTIWKMIAPYSEELSAEMNEVLGYCAQPLTKERPEGSLGNWVADVMKTEAERFSKTTADFAVCNYGGIRVSTLPEGEITRGRIFEIMPFDNVLVILDAKGSMVQSFLNDMARDGGWPVSSHLRFMIADSMATHVMINGMPLDTQQIYHIVMPDYVANGGDERFYLKSQPRQTLAYLTRDALITHVRMLSTMEDSVVVGKDGRIQIAAMN